MTNIVKRLWQKINEPRVISIAHAVTYFVLLSAGLYALVNPPGTVEGAVGDFAMRMLAGTLAIGGAIGTPTALAGVWWLERTAVGFILLSSTIYLFIIVALQVSSETSGNRWLQAGYVFSVMTLHIVRWYRVRQRPYDPDRVERQLI